MKKTILAAIIATTATLAAVATTATAADVAWQGGKVVYTGQGGQGGTVTSDAVNGGKSPLSVPAY